MKSAIHRGFTFLLISAFFASCVDEDLTDFDKISTSSTSPEFAIALVNSKLTIEDIITTDDTNSFIQTGANDVLEIVYSGEVFATPGGQFVEVPNESFNQAVSLPPGDIPNDSNAIPAGTPNLQHSENLNIAYNTTVEVDSLLLRDGDLVLTLESSFEHNINLTVTLNGVKDQNKRPVIISERMVARTNNNPTVRSNVIDLSGYTLDMTGGSVGMFNSISLTVDMDIEFVPNNGISASDQIRVIGELRGLDFEEFNGYIGQRSLDLRRDTIDIGMFKNFKRGQFFISNPSIRIDIKNSFGLPSNLNFRELVAFTPEQATAEQDIVLPTDPNTNSTNLRSLDYIASRGTRVTSIDIDKNILNGNIAKIISDLLKEIRYDSEVEFNPNGKVAGERNFFSDTSGISLGIDLKIPFEGRASDFFLIDTIALDMDGTSDLTSGTIRVIGENGFPVEVQMQMIFTDSLYNPLDSLYQGGAERIIPAAPIDGNGDAVGTTRRIFDTSVNEKTFEKISGGKYALIIAELFTQGATDPTPRNVRFKAGYSLGIGISVRAKSNLN